MGNMTQKAITEYKRWLEDPFFDEAVREELRSLSDTEIMKRFSGDLKFGTGGLRGKMGAGTARMNRYTVGRATAGLAKYLLQAYGEEACRSRGAAIAYDTRLNSRAFAEAAADILSAVGIRVRIFTEPAPTPMLSFAIRRLGCIAGVVITASHNPHDDNGYKVYDENGGQLVPDQVAPIKRYIDEISDYRMVSFDGRKDLIEQIDLLDDYAEAIAAQSLLDDAAEKGNLKIVYTPLHGTGLHAVPRVLRRDGFGQVSLVDSQSCVDGKFSSVRIPNPEDPETLEAGICLAGEQNADVVIATDPDADRIGAAVRTEGGFWILDGNQIGALLTDFVLTHVKKVPGEKIAVLSTVVSSPMGLVIARSHGADVFTTLTGFKYIGERMTQFERARRNSDEKRAYRFVFGYEESHGYLAGEHVRDKDAVETGMLFCEMAAYWKARGMTLRDRMKQLEEQFGCYLTEQRRHKLDSHLEADCLKRLMDRLVGMDCILGEPVCCVDYRGGAEAEEGFGSLPKADLLMFRLQDGSWAALRPSGTEAQLKMYFCAVGRQYADAEARLCRIRDGFMSVMDAEYRRLSV